ncbi:MAG: hypothetical protein AB7I59_13070 [Geminicoccaceae bacterium]
MAGRQGAARRRGPGAALIVRVHDLAEARRVLAATPEAVLVTAPDMAHFAGVGFWHAVERELGRSILVDCADDAGLVMAALREGLRDLLFTGDDKVAAKLECMAAACGARLRRRLDPA